MITLFAQETGQIVQESAETAGKFTQICGNFGIELGPLLMQCAGFGLLAVVIWWFGLRPVLAVVDERQKKIAEGLQFSEEMKVRLAAAEEDYRKKLAEAQIAAAAVIEEARKTAKATVDGAAQEAIAKAEEISKRAAENNAREHEKMLAELKSEVAGLVAEATAKLLSREATAEEKTRLIAAAAEAVKNEK